MKRAITNATFAVFSAASMRWLETSYPLFPNVIPVVHALGYIPSCLRLQRCTFFQNLYRQANNSELVSSSMGSGKEKGINMLPRSVWWLSVLNACQDTIPTISRKIPAIPRYLCKLNFLVFSTSLSGYHFSTCFSHRGKKIGK